MIDRKANCQIKADGPHIINEWESGQEIPHYKFMENLDKGLHNVSNVV